MLEAFINGMRKRIAEEKESLDRPLRSGQLPDYAAYKSHTGQITALDKALSMLAAEYKRLTQPEQPRKPSEEEYR